MENYSLAITPSIRPIPRWLPSTPYPHTGQPRALRVLGILAAVALTHPTSPSKYRKVSIVSSRQIIRSPSATHGPGTR